MTDRKVYEDIDKETVGRYQERYSRVGETPQALGWGCREDQLERFRIMHENYSFDGKAIIDIGCGFADFYGFLKSEGVSCTYIGVDVVPEFLECCRNRYPEAKFIQADVLLEADMLPVVDVAVTNGTLNYRQKDIDNMAYTEAFMQVLFGKARHAAVMDFLSTRLSPEYPKEEQIFYHDPKKVLELAFKYTDNIKLLHNYRAIPQKEFMLFMYKNN